MATTFLKVYTCTPQYPAVSLAAGLLKTSASATFLAYFNLCAWLEKRAHLKEIYATHYDIDCAAQLPGYAAVLEHIGCIAFYRGKFYTGKYWATLDYPNLQALGHDLAEHEKQGLMPP